MKSQDYPALVLVLMALLGMNSLYFDETTTHVIQNAFAALYVCWFLLRRSWYDTEELKKMPGLMSRY